MSRLKNFRNIEIIENKSFGIIHISEQYIICQARLIFHHKDPFDRLIVSQALTEKLEFLYTDKIFDAYLGR